MTRLTEDNIRFVKRHEVNGQFRYYIVSLKGGVSQMRQYYKEDGLPKTVMHYVCRRRAELFECEEYKDDVYTTYIWQGRALI